MDLRASRAIWILRIACLLLMVYVVVTAVRDGDTSEVRGFGTLAVVGLALSLLKDD